MKIVVTGSSGKIGRRVVQALMHRGDEVVGLDVRSAEDEKMPSVHLDILDFDAILAALRGADAVLHLAAIPEPRQGFEETVFRTNVVGTYNVVEACRRQGIRKLVVASSVNAIGLTYNKELPRLQYLPVDENHPAQPEDCYSLSKLVGEQIADAAARLDPLMSNDEYSQLAVSRCRVARVV